ncbi:MAG: TlpA family protein disulfide reductase, partial [Micromonosporaceae bacterium]
SVLSAAMMVGVLAGCAGGPEPGEDGKSDSSAAANWFQACPKKSAPSRGTAPPVGEAATASPMPSVSLPCIRPGDGVDLGAASGVPTVVNIWASWCRPCREELPAFQSYVDGVDGEVQVLGVVSGDTRGAAVALAKDLGVRFPTLFDEEGSLIRSVGRTALPVTLLVDSDGRLAYLYNGQPLTERSLTTLVERHLGVAP